MDLISSEFALVVVIVPLMFYALAAPVYYLASRRRQNAVLLVLSYFVYWLATSWWAVLVLAVMTALNYTIALHLRRADRGRRGMLWLGLGVNVLVWAVLKYEDFFVQDVLARLEEWGIETGAGGLELLLPVGLSFYVVATISYLLDVYRGQAQPATDPLDFALYMAYFPKLLAGPIERARDFLPKLAAPRVVDDDLFSRSLGLIALGVTRKIVIADTLTRMRPDNIFTDPAEFGGLRLTAYLVVAAVALYNDFAGYTAIARGVSGLLGIELSPNFRTPFFARSISEFWNRWHITLSHWLRDYIYFPTSRALLRRNPSRYNVPNLFIPPLLTMLVSGLWHGPGVLMLVWGMLHGVYLVGERLLAFWRPAGPSDRQPRWRQTLAMGVVFALVTLAWVPFLMNGQPVGDLIDYWRGMLDWSGGQRPPVRLLVVLLPALWIDWVQYRGGDDLVFRRWPRLAQATLLALVLLATYLATQVQTGQPFVYQGF